jgi:guanine nucleotide-binding protein subunit alpha
MVAISEYDQLCSEDLKTNRIDESAELFKEVVNNELLQNAAVILFLNKSDLFKQKIERVPLSKYDPNYSGPNDFHAGCNYFTNLFLSQRRDPSREVTVHVTCATNRDNVNVVFYAVKDVVLHSAMTGIMV